MTQKKEKREDQKGSELVPTLRVLLANGNKQVMGEDTRQQIGRQNSRHGPLGNDLRLLTRSQSQVASEVRSRPTIADKRKIV